MSVPVAVTSAGERWPRHRCPACGAGVVPDSAANRRRYRCPTCTAAYPVVDGIALLITPGDLALQQPFLAHYRRVRAAEGWATEPAILRTLPYPPPGSPQAGVWRRRARSYERLLRLVREQSGSRALDVLDLGAGTCWLAARLALLGHRVEALDASPDGEHGLGAARDLAAPSFGRTQGVLERLPYAEAQFDLVVAAASLHYAGALGVAVAEAARVLRRGGTLVLLDTPIYGHASAGRAAVARRIEAQRCSAGSGGGGTTGPGYLTWGDLRRCFADCGLAFAVVPVGGTLRALAGRLRRAVPAMLRAGPLPAAWCPPERAQMPLIVGRKMDHVDPL